MRFPTLLKTIRAELMRYSPYSPTALQWYHTANGEIAIYAPGSFTQTWRRNEWVETEVRPPVYCGPLANYWTTMLGGTPPAEPYWYLVTFWARPCDVSRMAMMARAAGLTVTHEGTEHVYMYINAASYADASQKAHMATRAVYHPALGGTP